MLVSQMESHAHKSLPVPPHQKFVHLLYLVNVVEKVEDGAVEPFGIGNSVASQKYGRRGQREANLYYNCQQ